MNRITKYAAMVQDKIDALDGVGLDGTPLDVAERGLDITMGERVAYQNAQATAHVTGKLSTDEAHAVYMAIGESGTSKNGGWARDTSYAMKITVTNLVGQLLGV